MEECRKGIHPQIYLRGSSKKLLNVQLVYKQRPSNPVNSHANVGLAVRNLQEFLDVLRMIEPIIKVCHVFKCQRGKKKENSPQTSESDTTSTPFPIQSMKS